MAEAPGAPRAPEQRALDALWAEIKAERDRRTARVNGKNKHSTVAEMKARREMLQGAESEDGATWYEQNAFWNTSFRKGAVNLTSRTYAEKDEAVRLWKAYQELNPRSRTNIKKRAIDRIETDAEKKAKNVAKNGHNSDLERELLNASAVEVNSTTLVHARVLMKQTNADAVFRTSNMLTNDLVELYIRWQHKTCSDVRTSIDERAGEYQQRQYAFASVLGYDKCLVVCECKKDGAIFVAYGKDIDEKYRLNKLTITLSARDVPRLGLKKGEPKLDYKPWLEYMGKGPSARIKLAHRLKKECDRDVLPRCTFAEADAEMSHANVVEEAGIQYFIRAVFGGIAPDNDPRWNDLPLYMQHKPHIYMLTMKDGDVVAYPEHRQCGESDLCLYRHAHNYERMETMQGKTVHTATGGLGLHANLHYKKGDNDWYFMVYQSNDTFHYWLFSEAEMLARKIVGTGKEEGFTVYMTDQPCKKIHRNGHAWTIREHRSMPLPAPSPSQSQASCSTDLP